MIDLVLDNNADQTLWQLNCGDDFVIKRIERDALHNNVDEKVKLCLCPAERTFCIFDTGYDGICFQQGQGYYNLFIEGREVYIGAEFEYGKAIIFDVLESDSFYVLESNCVEA